MTDKQEIIKRYVPVLTLEKLIENPRLLTTPKKDDFPAAVLFADISGFTKLTEKLTKDNPAGVKELAEILDIYIGLLIQIINNHGGDIIKFAGDAVFAVWKAGNNKSLKVETHRAVYCALIIQKKLHNYKLTDEVTLSLRVGVGSGKLYSMVVGGTFKRWELLFAGSPINQVSIAGKLAHPGEVVISPAVAKYISDIKGGRKIDPTRFRLNKIKETSLSCQLQRPALNPEAEKVIRTFIPRAILDSLDKGSDFWSADLRELSVIFVNISNFHFSSESKIEEIQKIMKSIQAALYFYEGSINRFGIDDKGAVVLAAFGLPPLSHEDDALRSVLCAFKLMEDLETIGYEAVVGIASGKVFCGSIGNEIRSEYTMHGSYVNLAARLMQAAKKSRYKVFVDEKIYEKTKNDLQYKILKPIKAKGVEKLIPVFVPEL